MLKQSLLQKLQQKLSPQQIQVIKLLELSTIELEEKIRNELEENPILDIKKNDKNDQDKQEPKEDKEDKKDEIEFTIEDYINEEESSSYKLYANNYVKEEKLKEIPISTQKTFHEQLHEQLEFRNLSEHKLTLGRYLIGNIDNDGYIRRELSATANDIAFSLNIETNKEELEEVLKIIQDFEPVGVGARNLRECLLLQIKKYDKKDTYIDLAYRILEDYFEPFTKKHYDKILKRSKTTKTKLKKAIAKILKLNPKPGNTQAATNEKSLVPYITPDFLLEIDDDEFILTLNRKNIPKLRINHSYINLIQNISEKKAQPKKIQKETISFVKNKLNAAKWFMKAIKQRQEMLIETMQTIINIQKDFFLDGDVKKLKPMILKDIADTVGLDISTISRITNSKFIQTPFGIYSLKYFFSESIIKKTGEELSTNVIKEILQDCVKNEDKQTPLTDEKIVEIMRKKSINLARRTIAKYREQLGIPVARLRKKL